MRSRIAIAAALLFPGCVSFLPPQSTEVYKQLSQSVDALSEMKATVALPGADTTYVKMQPFYARVFAGLDAAQATVDQRWSAGHGKLFERPARISSQTVQNCRAGVELLRQKNEGGRLIPNDFVTFPTIASCTIPKLIEGDLKREG